ncbi:MAG: 2-keto-3-deoxygluconate permease [Brachybacterium sp.]|nr:2-keto-3-deoxygluconate permease [Brachybacterium sp.]
MDRIPGGTMVIPWVLGAVVATTAPDVLELGSFTTALFATPMPLMALVIFATAVLISAITAPLIAAWVLRRNGAVSAPDADGLDDRGEPLPVSGSDGLTSAPSIER